MVKLANLPHSLEEITPHFLSISGELTPQNLEMKIIFHFWEKVLPSENNEFLDRK